MKKLFKSLAVLLALVLVLGTVSAAAADTKVTLKQSTKTLFIGGSTGTKLDGTKCLTGETKQMKNMLNNFDAETMKLIVTSDDESIVSVKKTTIKGEKMGTTTVNVLVVDKTTNDVILNKNVKVTVKKNATADTIKVTGIEDEATYSVSDVLNVTMPRSGVYSDTAVLKADSDDVVITPGEKSRTWTVSFKKAGTYTITGYTFQSSTYAGTTASVDFKVTVTGTKMIDAKQISSESLAILLDGEPTAADVAETVSVYQKASNGLKIAGTKVVKKVTADGNTLVVETYGTFSKDTTYYVEYKGVEASFVGCDLTAASVAKFVINEAPIVIGGQRNITITSYNAEGVKLTGVTPANLVFEKVSGANNASVLSNGKVFISKAGDQVTVRAYFTKYADGKANKIYSENEVTFTGTTQKIATGEVIGVLKASAVGESKPSDVQQPSEICVGDTAYVQFFAEYQDAIDTWNISYDKMVNTATTELEVVDKKVAVVSSTGVITPVSEGTTYILLKNKTTKEVISSVPLTVSGRRYAAYFTAEPTKTNVNVAQKAADSVSIDIKVYDQYDKAWGSARTFKVTNTDKSDAAMKTIVPEVGITSAAITGTGAISIFNNADGSVNKRSAVADGQVKSVYLQIEDTAATGKMESQLVVINFGNFCKDDSYDANKIVVGSYEIGGMKDVDTAITVDTVAAAAQGGVDARNFDITFNAMYAGYKVYALNTNAYNGALRAVAEAPVSSTATGATGTHFEIVVTTPDGVVTGDTTNIDFDLVNGKISVTPVKHTNNSANVINKIKAGNYTVDLYEVIVSDDSNVGTVVNCVDSKSFTVTDNQGQVVANQIKEKYTTAGDAAAIFAECFELSMNGVTRGLTVDSGITAKTDADNGAKVFDDGTGKAKLTTGFGYIMLDITNVPVVCFK